MARYNRRSLQAVPREQQKLFLKATCYTKCVFEKRPMTPAWPSRKRGKPSAYSIRLREKQKLRRMIQMNERPFETKVPRRPRLASLGRPSAARVGAPARQRRAPHGHRDVVEDRAPARQARHVRVGGKSVNIPSFREGRAGDRALTRSSRRTSASSSAWRPPRSSITARVLGV